MPDNYILTITAADLDILAAALGKAPYEVVAPLIERIRAQVRAQATPPPTDEQTESQDYGLRKI